MSEVVVDRLILSLPGLDAERARALALGVADGLASAEIEGAFGTLVVELDPAAAAAPAERLAARIVQQLLDRIG